MRRLVAVGAAAAVLLLGASPALASSVTAPATVTAHGDVPLLGILEERTQTGVAELRLTGPGAAAVPVARSARPSPGEPRRNPSRVEFPLATAPCNLPGALCEGGRVLPNGTWTVQLFEVDRPVGGEDVERGTAATLLVDVPALPPQEVVASLEGRTVTVRWARAVGPRGSLVEPDVRWTVSDSTGVTTAVGTEACLEGTCTAQLTYPDSAAGPRTVSVAASRPGSSAPTSTAAPGELVLPAVPGASPTPSPSGSPAAADGGTGQATARSLGQALGGFAPGARLPRLPGLPGLSSTGPEPGVAAPQVADTFAPELDYDDRAVEDLVVPEPQAAPRGRGGVLTATTGGLLGDETVARSLAGALVLLMTGAHLRTWLAGTRPEA